MPLSPLAKGYNGQTLPFDDMTVQDVVQLQEMLNVNPDGKWGAKSQAALDKAVALFGDAVQDGDKPDVVMNARIGGQFGEYTQGKGDAFENFVAEAGKYLSKCVNAPVIKDLIKLKEKLTPKQGVTGIALGAEGGIGWYTGLQAMFVIDPKGKMGIVFSLNVGGGVGGGYGLGVVSFPAMESVDAFTDKKAVSVSIGGGLPGVNYDFVSQGQHTGGISSLTKAAGALPNTKLGYKGTMSVLSYFWPLN